MKLQLPIRKISYCKDPPGTGKTFFAKRLAYYMMGEMQGKCRDCSIPTKVIHTKILYKDIDQTEMDTLARKMESFTTSVRKQNILQKNTFSSLMKLIEVI